jgi:hypothetical protein
MDGLDRIIMKEWQSQQAKRRFSEVIRKAEQEVPQKNTQREGTLIDFFQNSPHRDVELKIERKEDLPREIDL